MALSSASSQSPPDRLSLFETLREQNEIFYRTFPAARLPLPHWHDIDHNHTYHIREQLDSTSTVILDDERNVDTSSTHCPSPHGTQTGTNSQPPPLVDAEYNANSTCTSLEDPQACTFAGTHMFSHSREVSIHGGNFNNAAGDSFIISNGNSTIYQSYSQTMYSRLYSGRFLDITSSRSPHSSQCHCLAVGDIDICRWFRNISFHSRTTSISRTICSSTGSFLHICLYLICT
ncbi:hypothetical protein BDQ17DRAFT_1045194 [Cyathus striatus]|nr:hypothetical protein BDQ17DRAFT_1045194 [Cyathus striatus]